MDLLHEFLTLADTRDDDVPARRDSLAHGCPYKTSQLAASVLKDLIVSGFGRRSGWNGFGCEGHDIYSVTSEG